MAYMRLGDLLLDFGLIDQKQLEEALTLQKQSNERLGTVLISHGFITQQQLIEALQMQLGIEFIDLSNFVIPAEMSQYVPKNIAKKYSVVPIKIDKDTLYLAMVDPLNFFALEEIKKSSRKKIIPLISTQEATERAIITLYGNEGAARAIEDMRREGVHEAETAAGVQRAALDEDVQSAPTVRLVNSVIERAVQEAASDIHLEPHEDELRVRIRVDGVLRNVLTVPKDLQSSVIARLKVMAGMDTSERRIPQDGRANIRVQQLEYDLRVSTLPTIYGEKIVIRILNKNSNLFNRNAIGLNGEELKKYDYLVSTQSGVILIVGPTGSGKSSTMYTMVHDLNTEEVNLVTLEDPVEYNISGINQVQINEKTHMTFANGLRSILRQDPDIIAVGEIRDGETAEIAMRSAITGHLVLSTLHTNSANAAIDRLLDIGVEPYIISAALRGIISQRLVRKVCPDCKKEHTPTPEELRSIGLKSAGEHKFYKSVGCPNCFNTGYKGRTAVFEILIPSSALRAAIADNDTREKISALAQKDLAPSFAENCRRLVFEGVTTISEAFKAINSVEL